MNTAYTGEYLPLIVVRRWVCLQAGNHECRFNWNNLHHVTCSLVSTSPFINQLLRVPCTQCCICAPPGDRLIQGLDVLPLLTQALDKASAQGSQYQLVTEALSAACLLAKLSLADIQAGKQYW